MSASSSVALIAVSSPALAQSKDDPKFQTPPSALCSRPDLAARLDAFWREWHWRWNLTNDASEEEIIAIEEKDNVFFEKEATLVREIAGMRVQTLADVVLQARTCALSNSPLWIDPSVIECMHNGEHIMRSLVDGICKLHDIDPIPHGAARAPIVVESPVHPDHALLELGNAFERAWAIEQEAWQRVNHVDGKHLYAPLRATLAYDADSAVDRHIGSLLESESGTEPEASFLWIHDQRLRDIGKTGDLAVDQRIEALIAANEQWKAISDRPEVLTLNSQAEAAAERVRNIVEQVEDVPAVTIEGLKVKALALAWCYSGDAEELEEFPDGHKTDCRLVRSIVRDLRLLNGTRTAFVAESLPLAAAGDAV
jgi:hypothetical protein